MVSPVVSHHTPISLYGWWWFADIGMDLDNQWIIPHDNDGDDDDNDDADDGVDDNIYNDADKLPKSRYGGGCLLRGRGKCEGLQRASCVVRPWWWTWRLPAINSSRWGCAECLQRKVRRVLLALLGQRRSRNNQRKVRSVPLPPLSFM